MRRAALAVLAIAAGCGGSGSAADAGLDAAISCDDPPPWFCVFSDWCDPCDGPDQRLCECVGGQWQSYDCPQATSSCNPVAQTGCSVEEKCAPVRCAPGSYADYGYVGCVPNGTLAVGAACDPPVTESGYDDCIRGAFCDRGTCRRICTSLVPEASCAEGDHCLPATGSLVDVCLPPCDRTPLCYPAPRPSP